MEFGIGQGLVESCSREAARTRGALCDLGPLLTLSFGSRMREETAAGLVLAVAALGASPPLWSWADVAGTALLLCAFLFRAWVSLALLVGVLAGLSVLRVRIVVV